MPSSTIDSGLSQGQLRQRTAIWPCLDLPLLGSCFPSQRPGALPCDEAGRREEGNPGGGRKEPAGLLRPQRHLPHTEPPSQQREFSGAGGGEEEVKMQISTHACWTPAAQPSPVGGSRGWPLLGQTQGCTGPGGCFGRPGPGPLRVRTTGAKKANYRESMPHPRWHGGYLNPRTLHSQLGSG